MSGCSPDNNLSKLYWPGEFVTTLSNSECLGGAERLKVESLGNPELGQTRDHRGMPDDRPGDKAEGYGKDHVMLLPSLPNLNAHPQKGQQQTQTSTLLQHSTC